MDWIWRLLAGVLSPNPTLVKIRSFKISLRIQHLLSILTAAQSALVPLGLASSIYIYMFMCFET
jgi:hypothetical protein